MPAETTVLDLDFETFYSTKPESYSLRTMTTEEYILDQRFQVHGVSVGNGENRTWMSDAEFRRFASAQDWLRTAVIGHNLKFDGAILAWHYGYHAGFYIDTMGIANVFIRPYTKGVGLDKCSQYLGLPTKGKALDTVAGMRTHEILQHPGLWDALGEYSMQDGANCREIFRRYWPSLSVNDRIRLDWTVRNYLNPKLLLDTEVLAENLTEVTAVRSEMMAATGIDEKTLRSTKQFTELLQTLGIEVDFKAGKKGEIPAVSKKDPFMIRLLQNPDPQIAMLAKAKLVIGSSQEVSRTERFQRMAAVTGGRLLTPYIYCAAHTGRPGGTDGVNLTNLGGKSKLRKAIKAPPGYAIVTADASQVEARIVAELAGCRDLADQFRRGEDPYANFMSYVLGYTITKNTHQELRQCGKVCILALQYGVGAATLQARLLLQGIVTSTDTAWQYVNGYRERYAEILACGKEGCTLLTEAVLNKTEREWRWGMWLTPRGICRPNGSWLLYDQIQLQGRELVYRSHRYNSWQKLYPGSFNENMGQSLANDIVGETHVKYVDKVVMHNYDALSLCVPEDDAPRYYDELIASMSTPPAWAPTIPLAAEGKITPTFETPT